MKKDPLFKLNQLAKLTKNQRLISTLFLQAQHSASTSLYVNLAGNTATPVHILEHIYEINDSPCNIYLAFNSATPTELLAKLANNTSVLVRAAVAGKEKTSLETLAQLMLDQDKEVIKTAKKNYDYKIRTNNYGNKHTTTI